MTKLHRPVCKFDLDQSERGSMQVDPSSGQCIIATFLVQFEKYRKVFFSVQNICARVASVEVTFLIILL